MLGQPHRSWRFSSLLMSHHRLELCWLERQLWHLGTCPGPPKTHKLFPDPQRDIIQLKLPAWGQVPGCSCLNLSVDNPWNIRVPLVYSTPTDKDCAHHFDQQALKLQQPNLVLRSMGSESLLLFLFLIHFLKWFFFLLNCYITINNNQNGYITDFNCNQIVLK